MIVIEQPGPLSTVQDLGRPGLAHLGVSPSGAADRAAHHLANRLVGNREDAATIECTLGGLVITMETLSWVAVTGAPTELLINSSKTSSHCSFPLRAGDRLAIQPPPVGLRNYLYLAHDDTFHTVVRNSLVFTVVSVALKVLTGLAMALVLHATWRWRNFFRGLMLLPWITSTVIIALTWRWMFDAFPGRGFFNSVLLDAGLISRPIAFMATPEGAMAAVIVANWWRGFPFFGVSYLAAMQSIPAEMYEAAAVDGAGTWRRFWHVTLPGLKHIMIIVVLLSTIWTFNDFQIVYILTKGGPGGTTMVMPVLTYETAFGAQRLGEAIAVALYLLPALAVTIMVLARYMRQGRRR